MQVNIDKQLFDVADGETFINPENDASYMKINAGGLPGVTVPSGSCAVVELTTGSTTTFALSKTVKAVNFVAAST